MHRGKKKKKKKVKERKEKFNNNLIYLHKRRQRVGQMATNTKVLGRLGVKAHSAHCTIKSNRNKQRFEFILV
jgi:hypothetical protein